jgi:hypothetical protein
MNKRLNQAMLILAIVVVLTWLYMKRTSTKRIEKYEMDKSQIMQHLESDTKIDSILVMTAAAKITDDESKIQKSYELAESGDRSKLIDFFESM